MDGFLGEQRLLVIAPHADDETIGCGGLIAKVKENGGEVFVQVATVSDLEHYDGREGGVTFAHTRTEELAEATTTGNPAFSRAIVNRVWAIVFGRGLVHPVDQMDSAHPPSHPELLDWLAEDFAANGYDLRPVIRALMKTRAYQLDFRPPSGGDRPPLDSLFARALDKPLSAEALYRSMRTAAGHGTGSDEGMRASFASTFPDLFAEVYSPSVQQAMFVTNGTLMEKILSEEAPLIQHLAELDDPTDIVAEAFLGILGRGPDAEEQSHSLEFLTEQEPNRIKEKTRQLCWALLAGAEFRINH